MAQIRAVLVAKGDGRREDILVPKQTALASNGQGDVVSRGWDVQGF